MEKGQKAWLSCFTSANLVPRVLPLASRKKGEKTPERGWRKWCPCVLTAALGPHVLTSSQIFSRSTLLLNQQVHRMYEKKHYWIRMSHDVKNYEDLTGCYLDLHNSSYQKKAESNDC